MRGGKPRRDGEGVVQHETAEHALGRKKEEAISGTHECMAS